LLLQLAQPYRTEPQVADNARRGWQARFAVPRELKVRVIESTERVSRSPSMGNEREPAVGAEGLG